MLSLFLITLGLATIGAYAMPAVGDHLSKDDRAIFSAGEAVIAEYNVSTVYDFSTTGPGTFTFDSVPRFQAAGLDGTAKTTATDGVSKREGDLEKRTTVNCKDQSESKLLKDSLVESRDLIFVVAFYIDAYTVNDPIYKDYFGSNTAESVLKGFGAIFNQQSSSKVLACGDASERCSGSIASYTDDNQTLYFCPLFFLACYPADWLCKGASVDEEGVRGGIVISQLAYALMNAQEFKGGCSDSRDLPDEQKLINAANYECFALQVYQKTGCPMRR